MAYKISHYKYGSRPGTFMKTRRVTPASWDTKQGAKAAAKKMNKFNPGINARVVKV